MHSTKTGTTPFSPVAQPSVEIPLEILSLLGSLSSRVDRFSATDPLRQFPSLRDQLRRTALEALSQAARALEPVSEPERRQTLGRTLGALYEMETLTKVAKQAGALSEEDGEGTLDLAGAAARIVRARLARVPVRLAS